MDLRPGYKHSEIGIIPEDWEVRGLLDVVKIASGQVDPKIVPFNQMILVAPDHIESATGRLIATCTAKELNAISGKYQFFPGDIVYSKIRPYLQKAILADFEGLCSADMYPLRPKPGVSGRYVLDVLLAHRFTQYAISVSLRSGMPKINRDELADFTIALPPPAEQVAIAEALTDLDAHGNALESLIAKKRNMRIGTMQRLLSGETRLAGFTGSWQVVQLGECLSEPPSYGINAAAVPFTDRLPRYIRITDISDDGRFCPSPLVCVRSDSKRYQLEPGDLVFARTGASTGKTYLYDPADGELVYAGFLIRVRPDPTKLVPKFLAALTTTRHYWNWVKTMSMRSGQPGINGQEYSKFEFRMPSIEEQAAISQVHSDMDAEITALEARLEKARALKQGMMQALLTGRVRLPVQDEALDALEVAHA